MGPSGRILTQVIGVGPVVQVIPSNQQLVSVHPLCDAPVGVAVTAAEPHRPTCVISAPGCGPGTDQATPQAPPGAEDCASRQHLHRLGMGPLPPASGAMNGSPARGERLALMASKSSGLTDPQLEVLRWAASCCPPSTKHARSTSGASAQTLPNRGPVTIQRGKAGWRVSITEKDAPRTAITAGGAVADQGRA